MDMFEKLNLVGEVVALDDFANELVSAISNCVYKTVRKKRVGKVSGYPFNY